MMDWMRSRRRLCSLSAQSRAQRENAVPLAVPPESRTCCILIPARPESQRIATPSRARLTTMRRRHQEENLGRGRSIACSSLPSLQFFEQRGHQCDARFGWRHKYARGRVAPAGRPSPSRVGTPRAVNCRRAPSPVLLPISSRGRARSRTREEREPGGTFCEGGRFMPPVR